MTVPLNRPLNKTDLAKAIAWELGVTTRDGFRALNVVLDTIAASVTAGHDVTITNFGTFQAVERAARAARNPQNGEPVMLPARAAVRFRVLPRLRDVVRAGDPSASIRKRPSK